MPNSVAQTAALPCPQCRRPFEAEIWLIVDTVERPDLLARLRAGTLHDLPCPGCGHAGTVDAPILVYDRRDQAQISADAPGAAHPPTVPSPHGRGGIGRGLFFSPAQRTSAEEDRQHAGGLLGMLAERLGERWQDEMRQHVQTTPRELLPAALAQDPQAAVTPPQSPRPDGLQSILNKLSQPARLTDMPSRIELCRQALSLLQRDENKRLWAALQGELANSLAQTPRGDRADNIEQAIGHYAQALTHQTPEALPEQARRTGRNLLRLCFEDQRYTDVVTTWGTVAQAQDLIYQSSLVRSSKEYELGQMEGLAARTAYASCRLERSEDAVATIERGRARLLAEAMEQNRQDLANLADAGHPDLLTRYQQVNEQMAALQELMSRAEGSMQTGAQPIDRAALRQALEKTSAELRSIIAAIRPYPALRTSWPPPVSSGRRRRWPHRRMKWASIFWPHPWVGWP